MSIEPAEIFTVQKEKLHCDGGNGALGHPRVFLTMNKEGHVDCPYCGRRFILASASEGDRQPPVLRAKVKTRAWTGKMMSDDGQELGTE